MVFDEFVKKYDGKGIDYDGNGKFWCVDAYRQYVKECLMFPQSPPVPGAKDIWDTYLPDYFRRIENTPTGIPEKGDVVIFSTGTYGHVSVFVEGNATRFTSFDQNSPIGSLCHLQGHTYSAVIGWLTPLKKNMDIPEYFKTLLQERGLSLDREGEFRSFWEKALKYDSDVKSLQEQIKSVSEALADRALEVSMLIEKNQKLSDAKVEIEELLNKLRSEKNTLDVEKARLDIQVNNLSSSVAELEKQIETLKSNKPLLGYSFWERWKSLWGR